MRFHGFKIIFVLFLIATLSAGAAIAADETAAAAGQPTQAPPIAVVNGTPITGDEFNQQFSLFQQRMTLSGRSIPPDKIAYIQSVFLENMINSLLLLQESQKQKMEVEPAEIDQHINSLKGKYKDETEFQSALSAMNMTEQGLRKQILESLSVQKLVYENVEKHIQVSPEESRKFYENNRDRYMEPEQIRASHILAKVEKGADEKMKSRARMKIQKIQDRIDKGEDFATLAKELSEGPSSVNGGDLGFFTRGQMVPPFESAAFALQPNQLSDIVETQFGYHLIKLTDRKPEQKFSYEQVQDKVKNQVVQSKMKEAMHLYIKGLRDTAEIKSFLQ